MTDLPYEPNAPLDVYPIVVHATTNKKQKRIRRIGLDPQDGESRLAIEFENFGVLTNEPQTLGTRIIPHRLQGTFNMYGEKWEFKIVHGPFAKCPDGTVRARIQWTIVNLTSGRRHSVMETEEDSQKRNTCNRSICNRVFREALELSAKDYDTLAEEEAKEETPDMYKIVTFRARAKVLRPKRFAEGPLLFGLRHKIVYEKYN